MRGLLLPTYLVASGGRFDLLVWNHVKGILGRLARRLHRHLCVDPRETLMLCHLRKSHVLAVDTQRRIKNEFQLLQYLPSREMQLLRMP